MLIYYRRRRIGNNFTQVRLSNCVPVCLSVCLSVWAVTFEPHELGSAILVNLYILTISMSSLSIKVTRSRSRSNKEITYFNKPLPLGDFLCIQTPNTGQLNPPFHTFTEFRPIVNRIVAWQSTDWLAANAQFSPNVLYACIPLKVTYKVKVIWRSMSNQNK